MNDDLSIPDPDPGTLSQLPEMSLWSSNAKRYSFYLFFIASLAAVVCLLFPFTFALIFAAATASVAFPIQSAVLRRIGPHPRIGAALTMLLLLLAVILPVVLMVAVFSVESVALYQDVAAWLAANPLPLVGGMQTEFAGTVDLLGRAVMGSGPEGDVERAFQELLPGIAPYASLAVAWTARAGVDLAIYVLATFTLLADGPAVLRATMNVLPVDPYHAARLFQVFHEISNNFVVGTIATAVLQGIVAGVGLWIAGIPHASLLAVAIGLSSLVPMLGTTFVWVPVSIGVGLSMGWPLAAFVAVWNIFVTGTVDNLVKPMLLRGGADIHATLVFLAVFGGLIWFGLPGLLIGPVVVAFFVALYHIHCEEFLGIRASTEGGVRLQTRALLRRFFKDPTVRSVLGR